MPAIMASPLPFKAEEGKERAEEQDRAGDDPRLGEDTLEVLLLHEPGEEGLTHGTAAQGTYRATRHSASSGGGGMRAGDAAISRR